MYRSIPVTDVSTPRRFFLLPEDAVPESGRRPRVRRYKLASIGTGAVTDGSDGRAVSDGGEPGRLVTRLR